ncbi:DUF2142 domain-containing protein [Vagococcus fluvialis]|uniref:DUF2142 domain-containing protein n=1 Tax=Vagococcus fluvialis TaxID=2738 RepID=UPI003B5A81B0
MKTKGIEIIQDMWEKKIFILISLAISIFAASYSTRFDNVYWKFVILIFLISVFSISFIGKKIELVCFSIIIAFGSFFVIFSPVFDTLDEPAHYARAEHIAEGNLFLQNEDETLAFSEDYQYLTELMDYNGINRLNPKKNFFHTNLFKVKHNPEKKIETKIKATRTYGSIVYLPGALGLWIGKIISNGNLGVMFYLGRFLNLLMYALMAYFAIKMSGKWKLIIGFLSIQHLPIYISASFSQDAFFYGLSLLIAGKLIQIFDKEEPIDYVDVIQMTVLTGLMTFTKLPYIMLIGLMLFIPIKRYKTKKVYYSNFIGILLVILTGVVWLKYYSGMVATDLPKSVDQPAQIDFILNNPKTFFQSLMEGIMSTTLKFKQYFTFGWSYHYSELAYLSYLPILGAILFMYPIKLKQKINGWFKFALVGVSLAIIVMTNIILYLTFTGVGEPVISGVQGRYFYGLFVLLPFILNIPEKFFINLQTNGTLESFDEKKFERIVLFIAIIFLAWMSAMRIGAYY